MTYTNPDSIYRAANGTVAPITWGSEGVNDNLNYLADIGAYSCSYFLNGTQSISTGTDTLVKFDTADFTTESGSTITYPDLHGLYSSSTGLFTAKVAGVWEVNTQVLFSGSLTTSATILGFVGFFHNYTGSGGPTWAGPRTTLGSSVSIGFKREVELALNDTIGVDAWQNTGSTVPTGGAAGTFCQFRLICPTPLL